jgi:rhodanese-related sulfurtransferase
LDARSARESLGGLQLLDVRETYEFKAGHISGSTNIPLGELPARIDDLEAEGPFLVVCKVGARSDEAARFLQAFGKQAENLEGGVLAWSEAGFDLVTPEGEPGRVVV